MRPISKAFVFAVVLFVSVSLHAQWQSSGGNTTTTDNVGVGFSGVPQAKLHVEGSEVLLSNLPPLGTPGVTMLTVGNRAASGGPYLWRFATASSSGGSGIVPNAFDLYEYPADPARYCCFLRMAIRPVVGQNPKLVVIDGSGQFGVGVWSPAATFHVNGNGLIEGNFTVNGNVSATGSLTAKYQDVAEWVPARDDLEPGTVVVLSRDRANEVSASTRAYDTAVAGVVSPQPGLILGESGASKEMIATTGRVRVKVDARKTPIAIGDLLVSSDTRGVAMKSEPVALAGRELHMPGTIIGKALEPLAAGEGEILVLLSLQ